MTADDLQPDPHNANQGQERGLAILAESLDTCGFGRSILVDKHGTAIAGNKVLAAAQKRGTPVELVQTTGQELVVVQRTDLDLLTDRTARQLAYYDNRTHQLDLSWSADQVRADLSAGVNLGIAFFPEELDAFAPPPTLPPSADVEAVVPDAGGVPETALHPARVPHAADGPPGAAGPSLETADGTVEPPVVTLEPTPPVLPVAVARIQFTGRDARQRFAAFLRIVRDRAPDLSPGAALTAYLQTEVPACRES